MNKRFIQLHVLIQALREEAGQDLIEYVLIGGVVAVGAVAGMSSLAGNLNSAFNGLAGMVSSYA